MLQVWMFFHLALLLEIAFLLQMLCMHRMLFKQNLTELSPFLYLHPFFQFSLPFYRAHNHQPTLPKLMLLSPYSQDLPKSSPFCHCHSNQFIPHCLKRFLHKTFSHYHHLTSPILPHMQEALHPK